MTTFIETVQREAKQKLKASMFLAECHELQYEAVASDLNALITHTISRLIEDIERQLPEEETATAEDNFATACECIGHNTCLATVREIINKYKQ